MISHLTHYSKRTSLAAAVGQAAASLEQLILHALKIPILSLPNSLDVNKNAYHTRTNKEMQGR